MAKAKKTATKTITANQRSKKEVVSNRKNTSGSTRHEGRQRSGNNDPQPGSH